MVVFQKSINSFTTIFIHFSKQQIVLLSMRTIISCLKMSLYCGVEKISFNSILEKNVYLLFQILYCKMFGPGPVYLRAEPGPGPPGQHISPSIELPAFYILPRGVKWQNPTEKINLSRIHMCCDTEHGFMWGSKIFRFLLCGHWLVPSPSPSTVFATEASIELSDFTFSYKLHCQARQATHILYKIIFLDFSPN